MHDLVNTGEHVGCVELAPGGHPVGKQGILEQLMAAGQDGDFVHPLAGSGVAARPEVYVHGRVDRDFAVKHNKHLIAVPIINASALV